MLNFFKLFPTLKNHKAITAWLDKHGVKNYTINSDFSVDVDGPVNLEEKKLLFIPIDFGTVKGAFNIKNNWLSSLKGSPKIVHGNFECCLNSLRSLEFAPLKIYGDFWCSHNKIKSLRYCPQIENGSFIGNFNRLKNLIGFSGASKPLAGAFWCHYNQLTSLEGCPSEVEAEFNCSYNQLTSLKGAPEKVGWHFNCADNRLTSLDGAPKFVGDDFTFSNNPVSILNGLPSRIDGFINYSNEVNSPKIIKFIMDETAKNQLRENGQASSKVRLDDYIKALEVYNAQEERDNLAQTISAPPKAVPLVKNKI